MIGSSILNAVSNPTVELLRWIGRYEKSKLKENIVSDYAKGGHE
jgi:hypothetical protein